MNKTLLTGIAIGLLVGVSGAWGYSKVVEETSFMLNHCQIADTQATSNCYIMNVSKDTLIKMANERYAEMEKPAFTKIF